MNKITQKVLIILTLVVLLPATCMAFVLEQGTWRYKMTVTVETPEGLKTGSAVREVVAWREPKVLPEQQPGQAKISYGEAVAVDLGERGILFAVMFGKGGVDYAYMLPFWVFSTEKASLSAENIRNFSTLRAGPVEISPNLYPTFVHFTDITNPRTVSLARDLECPVTNNECDLRTGGRLSMSMEKAFGESVRIKAVTLEMTEEPVTQGIIDQYLPWLSARAKLPGYLGSDPATPGTDPTGTWVQTGAFKKGK